MRLLEAKETKFSVWIKSSLRLSWISYIGRIHKTLSIIRELNGNNILWFSSRLDKKKRRIGNYQIYPENWNSELAAFEHGFGSSNTDKLVWNFVSMLYTPSTCCYTVGMKIGLEESQFWVEFVSFSTVVLDLSSFGRKLIWLIKWSPNEPKISQQLEDSWVHILAKFHAY